MQRLILIETSTALCSAALAENGAIISYRESSAPKAHASLTAVFIQEMLAEKGLNIADCDAICVSMGPGSYTGLRVGVSTAKGLCFGSGKPMIAVGTLDTLVAQAATLDQDGTTAETPAYIVPMIDARRMEVYSAVFEKTEGASESTYRQITETTPVIVDETSFADILEKGKVLFIGDGAGKCADVIKHPNASFIQCWPNAASMLNPAMARYKEKRFEDVAYFEPFYLKEFVATVSKKKMW